MTGFLTINDLVFEREIDALKRRYDGVRDGLHRLESVAAMREAWYAKLAARRGEVVFALQRPDGCVLLHTKADYPDGVYRLLGGGIHWNEPVIEALHREVREETGFPVSGERLLGILTYEFTDGATGASTPFVSYVFRVPVPDDAPVVADEEESISGFRWVTPASLADAATVLRSVTEDLPGRGDWGRFRAVAHDFLCDLLPSPG